MIKMNFRRHSINQKVMLMLLIFLVPVIVLLTMISIVSADLVEKQAILSYQTNTAHMTNRLDAELNIISSYINSIYVTDHIFASMVNTNDSNEYYYAGKNLYESLDAYVNITSIPISMFFTRSGMPPVSNSINIDFPFDQKLDVSKYLEMLKMPEIAEGLPLFSYFTTTIDDNVYLAYLTRDRDTYMGCLIPLTALFKTISYTPVEDVIMYFGDSLGRALTLDEQMSARIAAGRMVKDNHMIIDGKDHILVSQAIPTAHLFFSIAVPMTQVVGPLGDLSSYFLAVLVIAVLFSFMLSLSINRILFAPMARLKETIVRIQQGQLNTKVELTGKNDEIDDVYAMFNTMMASITQLKVKSYETEIARQKTELQYLRLQLRPHFFLNSLKVLYALAETKRYGKIKEFVLCLSSHFRFLIYNNLEMITLEDELKHTQNYIQMHVLAGNYPIECSIEADNATKTLLVPSLIIQTFIENSIKYALSPNKTLKIDIQASIKSYDGNDTLNICTRDNGSGYPATMITSLQANEDLFFEQNVGLGNLKRRLNLLYGDRASLYIYNKPGGGACSDVLLPVQITDNG